MIKREALFGNWISYKMVWRGITIDQGESNCTRFRFLEVNRLITEIMVEGKQFFEDVFSVWEIQQNEGVMYISLDGIPHYEVVDFDVNNLILKSNSGILMYFTRDKV